MFPRWKRISEIRPLVYNEAPPFPNFSSMSLPQHKLCSAPHNSPMKHYDLWLYRANKNTRTYDIPAFAVVSWNDLLTCFTVW